jgi:lactate/malate dehydrogenase, NAD binding domain
VCKDEMNVWRLRTVGCELHYRGCGEQSSSTEWGAERHESDAMKLHADIVQDSSVVRFSRIVRGFASMMFAKYFAIGTANLKWSASSPNGVNQPSLLHFSSHIFGFTSTCDPSQTVDSLFFFFERQTMLLTRFATNSSRAILRDSMHRRSFSTSPHVKGKVAVLGAAGGIGQPLSLLLKLSPEVEELALYDIVGTPGVAADLSHVSSTVVLSYHPPLCFNNSFYFTHSYFCTHFLSISHINRSLPRLHLWVPYLVQLFGPLVPTRDWQKL